MQRVYSLLVDNNSGVLSRISGLFTRRGYNIDSITAGVTADPRFTRITIVSSGDEIILSQIEKQIAKLESKVVDEATGRRAMVPTGEEFAIECDLVLIAAGFTGCQPYVAEAFGVDLTKRGTVADTKYATNVPHVFTCGDMRRGQSLVVWALREGRDAAAEVDKSLMGYTNL